MIENFLHYLRSKAPITENEARLISSACTLKTLRKRQFLLHEGEVWKYNAFVSTGFVKTFSIDNKGIEHIINLAPENYWTGDRESLLSGSPSKLNIDAIEDSGIVLIRKPDFDRLCGEIPALNNLVNGLLEKSFVMMQKRIEANIGFNAEEKYRHFLEQFPAVSNRLPQHMIASYLGITPETLTRIRRNAAKPKL